MTKTIPLLPGQNYIEGHYLEEIYSNKRGIIFKMSKKTVYFYKESVVYPFVQVKEEKKGHFLTIDDYVNILTYVENTGLSCI